MVVKKHPLRGMALSRDGLAIITDKKSKVKSFFEIFFAFSHPAVCSLFSSIQNVVEACRDASKCTLYIVNLTKIQLWSYYIVTKLSGANLLILSILFFISLYSI